MNSRTTLCTYCQQKEADSADHVPPKNLFPKPRPANLITVPSCKQCNQGSSNDDEYFRAKLLAREPLFYVDEAKTAFEPVIRSFKRAEAKRFASRFVADFNADDLAASYEQQHAQGVRYKVDLRRIDRVLQRTVRGLHFHSFNKLLAPTDVVVLVDLPLLKQPDDYGAGIGMALLQGPSGNVGGEIFNYYCSNYAALDGYTWWLLVFYRYVRFFGYSGPKRGDEEFNFPLSWT